MRKYDVYLKPSSCLVYSVEAKNMREAEEIAKNMTKQEIIERLINSLEFSGYELEVINVEKVDD